jgi:acetyl esterase/lipase
MQAGPRTFTYKRAGGCPIKADVYQPAAGSGRAPILVYIHGGCLIYGSRKGINPRQLEQYLRAGYAVVSIDYRLAPESKLPEIIEDLEDAFRWIRSRSAGSFAGDPERLAVVGHSAGGYLTLMAGCRVAPRPKALVAFYGYGDIAGDWYRKPDPFYCQQPPVSAAESGGEAGPVISEPYDGRGKDLFYLYCRQNGLWPLAVGGRDPDREPSFFAPYCPVRNITADYPPTLLLHGDRDTDVPHQQSALMARALSDCQVEGELITMAGFGHGFDSDMENPVVRDAFARVLGFLERHLRR